MKRENIARAITAAAVLPIAIALGCAKVDRDAEHFHALLSQETAAPKETEKPKIASETPTEEETKTIITIETPTQASQSVPESEETATDEETPTESEEVSEIETSQATEPQTEPPTAPPTRLTFSPEEELLLLKVGSCEAGNQGALGIALVMRVVLNRAETYGMSIHDVIYAPRQFSVVGCGKWENDYIAPDAPAALEAIKDGWNDSQGALFFCSPRANAWHRSALTYLFTAGGHEFYK